MRKVYYNKLIRDNIPQQIKNKHGEYETYSLTETEFERELLKKVGEEAQELLNAKTQKEFLAELADITVALEEIKKIKKMSDTEFKEALKENIRRKGGFSERLFLVWSSDAKYKCKELTPE